MGRDYQLQKNNKYLLPRAVYHQTLWRIRDYYRLKREAECLIGLKGIGDLGERVTTSKTSDGVAIQVVERERLLQDVAKIDKALLEIPAEYREGVWNNIHFGSAYPLDADRSTYGRYKSQFICTLAERFGIL